MSFEDFWAKYPRKVSRKVAEQSWKRLKESEREAAIDALPNHIRYWELRGTEKEFIPHASTWLNQARWEDEIEMPAKKDNTVQIAWWASESGMLAKGKELGTQPRPGEDWAQFKSRLNQLMQRAA